MWKTAQPYSISGSNFAGVRRAFTAAVRIRRSARRMTSTCATASTVTTACSARPASGTSITCRFYRDQRNVLNNLGSRTYTTCTPQNSGYSMQTKQGQSDCLELSCYNAVQGLLHPPPSRLDWHRFGCVTGTLFPYPSYPPSRSSIPATRPDACVCVCVCVS